MYLKANIIIDKIIIIMIIIKIKINKNEYKRQTDGRTDAHGDRHCINQKLKYDTC